MTDISSQSEMCALKLKAQVPCIRLTGLNAAGQLGEAAPRSSDWAELQRMMGVSEVCKGGTGAGGRGCSKKRKSER